MMGGWLRGLGVPLLMPWVVVVKVRRLMGVCMLDRTGDEIYGDNHGVEKQPSLLMRMDI